MKKLTATLGLAVLLAAAAQVQAQEIILKVADFLPLPATINALVLVPWCDRILKESGGKMKCQIYPSMQLGGTPAQLYDQAKDGIADIIWVPPGYTAGRFPRVAVFELPFMMRNPEGTSRAAWDWVQANDRAEFKDVHPLAFHVHGPGEFHLVNKPINTLADLKGLRLRGGSPEVNKMLGALGAVPIDMPAPQLPDALSKGVIDGTVVPWEIVPALKLQELTKFHSVTDPSEPALYTSVFILAMNKAKYDGLPPDMKKVIDANSGAELSDWIGKKFVEGDELGRKVAVAAGNTINVIPAVEVEKWKKLAGPVIARWVKDVTAKGANGKALLESARSLIAKYNK